MDSDTSETSSSYLERPQRQGASLESSGEGESLQIIGGLTATHASEKEEDGDAPQTQQMDLSATSASEDSDVNERRARMERRELSESESSFSSAKLESMSDDDDQGRTLEAPRSSDILMKLNSQTQVQLPPQQELSASPNREAPATDISSDLTSSEAGDPPAAETVEDSPNDIPVAIDSAEAPPQHSRDDSRDESGFMLSPITPAAPRTLVTADAAEEATAASEESSASVKERPDALSKQTLEYTKNIESMLSMLHHSHSPSTVDDEERSEVSVPPAAAAQERVPRIPIGAEVTPHPAPGATPPVSEASAPPPVDGGVVAALPPPTDCSPPSPATEVAACDAQDEILSSSVGASGAAALGRDAVVSPVTQMALSDGQGGSPPGADELEATPSQQQQQQQQASPDAPANPPAVVAVPTPQNSTASAVAPPDRAVARDSMSSMGLPPSAIPAQGTPTLAPTRVNSVDAPPPAFVDIAKNTVRHRPEDAKSLGRDSTGSTNAASATASAPLEKKASGMSVRSTRAQALREAEQKRRVAEAAAEERKLLQQLQHHGSQGSRSAVSRIDSLSTQGTPESRPRRQAGIVPSPDGGMKPRASVAPSGDHGQQHSSAAGTRTPRQAAAPPPAATPERTCDSVELMPRAAQPVQPQPQVPAVPEAVLRPEDTRRPGRCTSATTPKRTHSGSARPKAMSPVLMPSPVSPAGRYTKHASDIVTGGKEENIRRFEHDEHQTYLRECIRQKEAARRERKNVMEDLNSFLEIYAGSTGGHAPAPDAERDDWERRRVLGKALFTRASGGTPGKSHNRSRTQSPRRLAQDDDTGEQPQPSYSAIQALRQTSRPAGRVSTSPALSAHRAPSEYSARPMPGDAVAVDTTAAELSRSPHISPARPHTVAETLGALGRGEELRAESWREAVKRRKDLLKAANGSTDKLFHRSVELAKEKRRWADSERMKETVKRNLEPEMNMTFNPKISSRSRSIDSSARRDVVRDQNTRLPVTSSRPSPHAVAKTEEFKQVFGRTTREKPPTPPATQRSSSAPVSQRITTLAQPRNREVIEGVAAEVYREQNMFKREAPVDDGLLRKRDIDVRGQQVGHYLYNDGREQMEKRSHQERQLDAERKSNSNVGKYLSSSSVELANKRKRERLVQLFHLLDVAGTGKVTEHDVTKADDALKSVRSKIVDPKETAILQALTEAATILKGSGRTEFTVDTFVDALEAKIGRSGPLAFMHPATAQGRPRYNPNDGVTFNPRITERSREMATRGGSTGERPVHARLFDIAAQQQARREEQWQQREEAELQGLTFKPKVNKARRRPPKEENRVERSASPDDVLAHIDSIVGEAAEWLKGVSGRARSPSLSVSPPTPGLGYAKTTAQRASHGEVPVALDMDAPVGGGEVYDRHGEYAPTPMLTPAPVEVVSGRRRVSTHDGRVTHVPTVSPPRPHRSPQGRHVAPPTHTPPQAVPAGRVQRAWSAQTAMHAPSEYDVPHGTTYGHPVVPARPDQPLVHAAREPPSNAMHAARVPGADVQPRAVKQQKKTRAPPQQAQQQRTVSLMSLRSASSSQLAAAGKLLMQQQLETHRFLSR